ncbi:MAG: DUF3147 family protein [Planctomycetes bacterium]|nr:DUF3147 family protein [Planctomycetota bacterium]
MSRFIIKLCVSLLVILLATQIGRKAPSLAGLIAVMPLTGLLVLLWLYWDHPGDFALMTDSCQGALLGLVPTVLFFATALLCFRRHLPLWAALAASFTVWLLGAFVHQWLLRRPQ